MFKYIFLFKKKYIQNYVDKLSNKQREQEKENSISAILCVFDLL